MSFYLANFGPYIREICFLRVLPPQVLFHRLRVQNTFPILPKLSASRLGFIENKLYSRDLLTTLLFCLNHEKMIIVSPRNVSNLLVGKVFPSFS